MTTANRHRLAEWSPIWWRVSPGADEAHPHWLRHLVRSDGPIFRVVVDDGVVVGCAVALPQREQWFIDDVAVVHDSRWEDAGQSLLAATSERPALTCAATADTARIRALEEAGLARVSSYWIGPPGAGTFSASPLTPNVVLAVGPPHTFGGPFDPAAEGALTFRVEQGLVVGSPSISAPPIYDPGGTVSVVDRVVGTDRPRLLELAMFGAAERGDVLLAVVSGADDLELDEALASTGLDRTVDVYAWR